MGRRPLLSERSGLILGQLADAAELVVEAAVALEDACMRYPEPSRLPAPDARGALDDARRAIHAAFALPADPRDLLRAVAALDASVAAIDAASAMIGATRPASLPDTARAQAATLALASMRVADAWARVRARRSAWGEVGDVRGHEREGDHLRRAALAALFASGLEPMEILRLQAIHEALEEAIDRVRAAGDALGALVLTLRT